jgi:YegS/Rv2252/BmrU family lipid kinase
MGAMKTFLVVNPNSAGGRTGRRWASIDAELKRSIGTFQHAFTSGPMHATEVASRALKDGYERIVAVGGDGTLNEVVNGFFDGGKAINSGAALGVIACGTGGDFRKTFSWSTEVGSAAQRLKRGQVKPLDIGRLEYLAHDGTTQTRYFANVCSFGISGVVDQEVNRASKALGGKASFLIASVKALLKYQDCVVRLRVDGGPQEVAPITAVAVANGRYFGGGMKVAPNADPADGLFDVTIWSGFGLVDFAFRMKRIYSGSHVEDPRTRTLRCREVIAESDAEVLIDIDGEQPGRLPCRMTMWPGALQLVV